jgi:hypothetical protein
VLSGALSGNEPQRRFQPPVARELLEHGGAGWRQTQCACWASAKCLTRCSRRAIGPGCIRPSRTTRDQLSRAADQAVTSTTEALSQGLPQAFEVLEGVATSEELPAPPPNLPTYKIIELHP